MAQIPMSFRGKPSGKPSGKPGPPPAPPNKPYVFTVSELQARLRNELESGYSNVFVGGEISNLLIHGVSGHAYFTLKDAGAQLKCLMWHDQLSRLAFRLENGQQVVARGKVTIYDKGGQLQMGVVSIDPVGLGALQEAYRQLAAKLRAEGLTDPKRRRKLPAFPRAIGVVTSPTGAALRDVLRTILRRDPEAHVVISPCPVQGAGCGPEIADALRRLDRSGLVEVILLVRGGGSIEDLWAFNQEPIARAIAASSVPVVTGVGHETDTTIADLVADLSASTPTAAAERAVPVRREIELRLAQLDGRLRRAMLSRIERASRRVLRLEGRLRDPIAQIRRRAQRLDELTIRGERVLRGRVASAKSRLAELTRRLAKCEPHARLRALESRLSLLEARQDAALRRRVASAAHRHAVLTGRLESLSPVAILARGYALVAREDGKLLRDASDARAGDAVEIRLSNGRLAARVESVLP